MRLWLALLLAWGLLAAPLSGQERPSGKPPKLNFQIIFDYQQQLGLTNEQSDKIRQTLTGLATRTNELRAKKKMAAKLLLELIQNDAPLPEIRKGLEAIAALEVQARYDDIATAREIAGLLTAEQRTRWAQIQTAKKPAPSP